MRRFNILYAFLAHLIAVVAAEIPPILLDNCGPAPYPAPVIQEPPIVTGPHEEPLQILPHPLIPAPRIIKDELVCHRTILKPQLYQRLIVVPKTLHFVKNSFKPVVEHIPYTAKPICPEVSHLKELVNPIWPHVTV